MKHLLSIVCLLHVCCVVMAQDADFTIIRDTVQVDIEGNLTQILEQNGKYYCFFEDESPNGATRGNKRMYIILPDGQIEHCIDSLPRSFESYYPDFYIRNDSLIYRIYYDDHDTYFFDKKKLQWVQIPTTDDLIYEDDDYYVTSLDFGEWGGATWFRHKATGKEYCLGVTTPKVLRLGNSYFLSQYSYVLEIADPRALHECSPEQYYQYTVKNEKFFEGLFHRQGITTTHYNSGRSYYDFFFERCPFSITTSLVVGQKLYHLVSDDCMLYIAKFEDRIIRRIKPVTGCLNIYNFRTNNYRSSIQKDGSQMLKFTTKDDKMSGLMKIKGDTLFLHYIDNKFRDRREPRGKKFGDKLFKNFFASACSNYGNKNIYEISDYQKNTNKAIQILDDNRETHNSRMGFYIIEDSTFVHEITYSYSQIDSLPKRSLYVWKDYDQSTMSTASKTKLFENRFKKIKQFIASYLQKNNLKAEEEVIGKYEIKWVTTAGTTISLGPSFSDNFKESREIRLFIGYGR